MLMAFLHSSSALASSTARSSSSLIFSSYRRSASFWLASACCLSWFCFSDHSLSCSCWYLVLALLFRSSPSNRWSPKHASIICESKQYLHKYSNLSAFWYLYLYAPEIVNRGSSSCTLAGLSFFSASGSYKSHSLLPSGCWCIILNSFSALFKFLTSSSCLFCSMHATLSFLSASAATIYSNDDENTWRILVVCVLQCYVSHLVVW